MVEKGRKVWREVMSVPKAKLPLPTCIGVVAVRVERRVGLKRVTRDRRLIGALGPCVGGEVSVVDEVWAWTVRKKNDKVAVM